MWASGVKRSDAGNSRCGDWRRGQDAQLISFQGCLVRSHEEMGTAICRMKPCRGRRQVAGWIPGGTAVAEGQGDEEFRGAEKR